VIRPEVTRERRRALGSDEALKQENARRAAKIAFVYLMDLAQFAIAHTCLGSTSGHRQQQRETDEADQADRHYDEGGHVDHAENRIACVKPPEEIREPLRREIPARSIDGEELQRNAAGEINDTIEGRARYRRVELSRKCS
jgi:hypothetical protein